MKPTATDLFPGSWSLEANSSTKVKLEGRQEVLQLKEEYDIKDNRSRKRNNEVMIEQETLTHLPLGQNAERGGGAFVSIKFPNVLKEELKKKQESFSVKRSASLSSSAAQFVPPPSCWPIYPEKRYGDLAQMAKARSIGKEYPPLEMFYGNKRSGMGAEDMEAMRQFRVLNSYILNEKGDNRVRIKTDSVPRTENPSEKRSHRVSNSTALLLSQIGKEYTEELTGARLIRQSGGKDRHCKVVTSRGPRDRRVRLSIPTATQFYDVQDRLGYDQPSKVIEWLIKEAKSAIDELGLVPDLGLQKFEALDRISRSHASMIETNPNLYDSGYGSRCTTYFSCFNNDRSSLEGARVLRMNPAPEEVQFERTRRIDSMNASFADQAQKNKLEEQLNFHDPPDRNSMLKEAMDCWTSPANGTKDCVPSFASAEFQQIGKTGEKEKATGNGSSVEACREAATNLQSTWVYRPLNDVRFCASPSYPHKEASQFDRRPSEQATICMSSSSSSTEALLRSNLIPQNLYALQNHKTPLSQRRLQYQFHQGPFQLSFPSAGALVSSQIHSSVTTLQSALSTIPPIQPSHPAISRAPFSLSENDVQVNANIIVPSEFPVHGSNIVSPPAVYSIRSVPDIGDEYKNNVALLQSMALFSPEICDFGTPINDQGSSGDQITKIASSPQGHLFSSMLAAGDILDQEDLLLGGYACAEDMFSSISSPIPNASEGFVSSSTSPLACSSAGSLQSNQSNLVPSSGTSATEMPLRPGAGV